MKKCKENYPKVIEFLNNGIRSKVVKTTENHSRSLSSSEIPEGQGKIAECKEIVVNVKGCKSKGNRDSLKLEVEENQSQQPFLGMMYPQRSRLNLGNSPTPE